MQTADIKRGGARPGAGRKCLAPEARRVPVCFSVSPEARRKLQELRQKGVAVNELVEDYIQVLIQVLHYDNINCGFKIK